MLTIEPTPGVAHSPKIPLGASVGSCAPASAASSKASNTLVLLATVAPSLAFG
jgi:hypothetical protein